MSHHRGRQPRHPNFTPLQLSSLLQQVQTHHAALFGKNLSKEEKQELWEQIAERVNELDPKGFQRSGAQAKRKYIKYTSEQRLRERDANARGVGEEGKDDGDTHPASSESQAQDEEGETITLTEENVSFVDVIGMIPDASVADVSEHSTLLHTDLLQERVCLQKIGLFMKMKKYQKQGFLTATDVRMVTRWIKNPAALPFRSSCRK